MKLGSIWKRVVLMSSNTLVVANGHILSGCFSVRIYIYIFAPIYLFSLSLSLYIYIYIYASN
jgi:hypothetical protein